MPANNLDIRQDVVLTNIVRGFAPGGFVVDQLLPTIPVSNYTGKTLVDGSEHFRIHNTEVNYSSETPMIKISQTKTDTWDINEHALKIQITDKDVDGMNAGNPELGMQQALAMASQKVANARMVSREAAVIGALVTTGNYTVGNTVTLSGTDQYNDFTNSDPIGNFDAAFIKILDNSRREPNVVVMNAKVYRTLLMHTKLKQRLATNVDSLGMMSGAQLALALNVDTVLVSRAQKNTAAEGQSAVMDWVMDNSILFAYVDRTPVANEPSLSLGYSFRKRPMTADQFKTIDPEVTYVRVREALDDVIMAYSAAYLIKAAVA